MESLPVTPAATSTAHPTEASHGAAATPTGELGDFFLVRKQANLSLSPAPDRINHGRQFLPN
jgi:hypothetical protein